MKRNLALLAACASAAAILTAGSASAAATVLSTGSFNDNPDHQYTLIPFTVTEGITSSAAGTMNVPQGKTVTDDFSFGIGDNYQTTAFGSFGLDTAKQQFTDANLQLYSGTVSGTHTFISGIDYDPATDTQQSLQADLMPGTYFVQATVTAPSSSIKGDSSPITLSATVHHISAAPEPSTWLLMMMGVGALGMGLRYQRRQFGALAA